MVEHQCSKITEAHLEDQKKPPEAREARVKITTKEARTIFDLFIL
jgi:hypothetical protein